MIAVLVIFSLLVIVITECCNTARESQNEYVSVFYLCLAILKSKLDILYSIINTSVGV